MRFRLRIFGFTVAELTSEDDETPSLGQQYLIDMDPDAPILSGPIADTGGFVLDDDEDECRRLGVYL